MSLARGKKWRRECAGRGRDQDGDGRGVGMVYTGRSDEVAPS
jgi:hypothetical protein